MLGLGLAVLFRKACNGNDCLSFKGPQYNDIHGKTYQFGDSCYKNNIVSGTCDSNKKTLDFTQNKSDTSKLVKEGLDPIATVGPMVTGGPRVTPMVTPMVTDGPTKLVPTASNSPPDLIVVFKENWNLISEQIKHVLFS